MGTNNPQQGQNRDTNISGNRPTQDQNRPGVNQPNKNPGKFDRRQDQPMEHNKKQQPSFNR